MNTKYSATFSVIKFFSPNRALWGNVEAVQGLEQWKEKVVSREELEANLRQNQEKLVILWRNYRHYQSLTNNPILNREDKEHADNMVRIIDGQKEQLNYTMGEYQAALAGIWGSAAEVVKNQPNRTSAETVQWETQMTFSEGVRASNNAWVTDWATLKTAENDKNSWIISYSRKISITPNNAVSEENARYQLNIDLMTKEQWEQGLLKIINYLKQARVDISQYFSDNEIDELFSIIEKSTATHEAQTTEKNINQWTHTEWIHTEENLGSLEETQTMAEEKMQAMERVWLIFGRRYLKDALPYIRQNYRKNPEQAQKFILAVFPNEAKQPNEVTQPWKDGDTVNVDTGIPTPEEFFSQNSDVQITTMINQKQNFSLDDFRLWKFNASPNSFTAYLVKNGLFGEMWKVVHWVRAAQSIQKNPLNLNKFYQYKWDINSNNDVYDSTKKFKLESLSDFESQTVNNIVSNTQLNALKFFDPYGKDVTAQYVSSEKVDFATAIEKWVLIAPPVFNPDNQDFRISFGKSPQIQNRFGVIVDGVAFPIEEYMDVSQKSLWYVQLLRQMRSNRALRRIIEADESKGLRYFNKKFHRQYPTEKIGSNPNKYLHFILGELARATNTPEIASERPEDVPHMMEKIQNEWFFVPIETNWRSRWVIDINGVITQRSLFDNPKNPQKFENVNENQNTSLSTSSSQQQRVQKNSE